MAHLNEMQPLVINDPEPHRQLTVPKLLLASGMFTCATRPVVMLWFRLWQHVTSAIMDRDQLRATQEKFVLEEAQRGGAKERGDKPWSSHLFHQDPVTSEWTYRHME